MKTLVLKSNPKLFIDAARLGGGIYTQEKPTLFGDDISLSDIQQLVKASDEIINQIEFKTYHVVDDYMMRLIINKLEGGHPNFSNSLRAIFGIVG